ncbi:hypothetical protein [Paenibacillus sp. FSL K6-2524]|uniref:hypothetical protein n=1 Tax=Paenibacillus sp. FSL K6-2524 TaxID=2954516 RepID=UPI0030FCECD3
MNASLLQNHFAFSAGLLSLIQLRNPMTKANAAASSEQFRLLRYVMATNYLHQVSKKE